MTTAAAPSNGAPTSRMSLDSIIRKVERQPDRILLVGTEGVGKTTFAADSNAPVFICAENGIPSILGEVPRFPAPQNVEDVLDCVRTLIREDHEFKTLVVDTVDWLEPIVWADLCKRNSWASIEAPGYGKGYVAATEEWRRIIAAFDALRARKGMEVILLAHATIKNFANPAGDDYARYECKLNKSAAALLKEWADSNLFAIHEEFVSDHGTRSKGVSTGRRVIHTNRTSAWDAKNRWDLPDELPLNYQDYVEAREAGQPADPDALMAEGRALIDALELDAATNAEWVAGLDTARSGGAAKLARSIDRLRSKVAEKEVV